MAIGDDFTIDYVNKRVTHSSGTTIYSGNALYSYLQDTFDELTQLDDTIPMSAQTPTDYTLINGWFMDDISFQFLKGGAIKTSGYNNEIRILTLQSGGYISAVSGDIGKTVTGGTTLDTGKLLAYNNTTREWWVRMDDSGDLFDVSEALTISGGTGAGTTTAASVTGEDLWPNVYTLGTIEEDDSQQIYIMQAGARAFSGSEWWPEGGSGTRHIDILIKTQEAGTEIAAGKITVFLRHYLAAGNADLYDHFEIDLTAGGRNAVPLATSPDLNNTTATATVSGYSDITIAFVNGTVTHGSVTGTFQSFESISWTGGSGIFLGTTSGTMTIGNISGDNGPLNTEVITGGTSGATATASANTTIAYTQNKAFQQQSSFPYSVIIGCATRPLTQVYEYLKYLTRIGSTFTTRPTTTTTGPSTSISQVEGQLYIRAHEDTQGTPTNVFSPVKASPFGTFAGGKLFGAQGVWVENMASADIQAFQLIDSNGNTRTPPNQITVSVTNTLASDRIAVFKTSGGQGSTTIDKAMFTAATGNNIGLSTFVINQTIPSDTPSSGSIRVVDVSDTSSTRETRYTYTSWSGSTFSGLSPTLDRSYTATSDTAYVPYIDGQAAGTSISNTVIYASSRYVLVRVRRKATTAILPFETTGEITSTGYSVSTIRTTDSIVT